MRFENIAPRCDAPPSNPMDTPQDLDLLDDVAFENLIDDVDAVQHLGEDGVVVIEARVVDEIDEDLRVAGVAAARRDADRAAHVRPLRRPRRA